MSLTLWWMTIPSGKESRDNMDGGFPQQIYSIDCHYWNTNVSWQGLAAIITRENEGIGSMYLIILWFASKEFAADSCVLSWIPLPWQDLFLLQCSVEKMTLDSPTDGRHSNSEADNFILGPWENLVIAVPQFICLDEGGRIKLYFHSQLLIPWITNEMQALSTKQSSLHSRSLMVPINGSLIKYFIPAWSELSHDSQATLLPVVYSIWCSNICLLPTRGNVPTNRGLPAAPRPPDSSLINNTAIMLSPVPAPAGGLYGSSQEWWEEIVYQGLSEFLSHGAN